MKVGAKQRRWTKSFRLLVGSRISPSSPSLARGEQTANMLFSPGMARRPDNREAEILKEEHLAELRHNLAHLSLPAVRDFYEKAYQDCRLIYNRVPSPKADSNPGPSLETVAEVEIRSRVYDPWTPQFKV